MSTSSACVVIGVSGASASGKTYFANRLVSELTAKFGPHSVGVICEDFYYHDQSHMPMAEREKANYDHPNSMDHELLITHLKALKSGQTVQLPQYDYTQHTRASATVEMTPKKLIVVEGILLFTNPELRKEMKYLIFVDTPLDICLIRRAKRDMAERGRTFDFVIRQYEATVRPMYYQFVEPSRRWADIIVPSWKDNGVAIDVLKAKMGEYLDCKL